MHSRLRRSAGIGAGALAIFVAGAAPATAGAAPTIDGYSNSTALGDFVAQSSFGQIPFTAASVTAGSTAGSWTASWQTAHAGLVAVFVGPSATHMDHLVKIAFGNGSADFTLPSTTLRPWVRLVPLGGSPLVISNRDLGLTSDPNMRDVGGYRASDGQWVRAGLVYRSQAFSLSSADTASVETLGLTNDFDLRTTAEITAKPDTVLPGVAWTNLNVLGSSTTGSVSLTSVSAVQQYMESIYSAAVTSSSGRSAYHDLLTGIANATGAVVFHCSAGKDRAGIATALLLSLLGVPYATIEQDYLLSNTYYLDSPAIQAELASVPAAEQPILEAELDVDPAYLQATFTAIDTNYGSFANYLTAADGLDLSQATINLLKSRLLTGAAQR